MSKYVVAKYIRLSLEDEKVDSISISNQRLLLDNYVNSFEITDVETLEFVDNGYTGLNFERPGIQELLELVRQSKINCVIVKDFSRFGRNMLEAGYFIEMVFPLFRTRFISISDGFDSDNYRETTGGIDVAFKFLINEYYSRDISKKSKAAKYDKMRRGEYQGEMCPYGYRKGTNGRLEIDDEAAEVVKMIFECALNMRNAADVVKALYERKIPTPGEYRKSKGICFHDISRSMGIWQRSQVLRILEDERYTGMYVMGKRTSIEIGGSKLRLKPESEWFKLPDHHAAIVSRELYEQVQIKILRFKCNKTMRDYPLRAKVVCGCCRHAMNLAPRKTRAFVCRYIKVDENAECRNLEIGEQELEDLLFEVINKQAQVILNIDGLGDTAELSIKVEQQAEYEKQINICQDNKRIIYEKFVLGELDKAAYMTEKSILDAELARLTAAFDILKSEADIMSVKKSADDKLKNSADTVLSAGSLTRPLVDLLIDKVYVYPGNHVEIAWKAADFGLI